MERPILYSCIKVSTTHLIVCSCSVAFCFLAMHIEPVGPHGHELASEHWALTVSIQFSMTQSATILSTLCSAVCFKCMSVGVFMCMLACTPMWSIMCTPRVRGYRGIMSRHVANLHNLSLTDRLAARWRRVRATRP